jgi:two-component system response regulator AtoC
MGDQRITILIVDDEANIRRILQAAFERDGYQVLTAESGRHAVDVLAAHNAQIMISDVVMPDMDGTELLAYVHENQPDLIPIMMTAYGTIPQAVAAMRMGAFDYVSKPFDLDLLRKIVANALEERSAPQPKASRRRSGTGETKLIAVSPEMCAVIELADQVAESRATVLITGESGTGKEVVARFVHERSSRAGKPFVAVSCAALPETLLEAELFGHEKGAYTGAVGQRPGRFELASGGTLFLDEIGEVPLPMQVKLLRVLQEREIERLGGTKPIRVDVRLVAATNCDLQQSVEAGTFRTDLFYRLQVVHLELPPLRKRRADIQPLAEHFIRKYCEENGRNIAGIDEAALAALQKHKWPGNVRELENVIERAVVLSSPDASLITPDLLPPGLKAA